LLSSNNIEAWWSLDMCLHHYFFFLVYIEWLCTKVCDECKSM